MKTNNTILAVFIILLFLSCGTKIRDTTSKDVSCYEFTGRPTQALTYKEVASMIKHYDDTKRVVIKNSRKEGKDDTWLYHYNLEDLKAYIAYVEKLSKDKNIKVTGINIRAAAYPNNHDSIKKRDYQTLIFIPTTTINGKERVSFDPIYSKNRQPALFDSIVERYKNIRRAKRTNLPDIESAAANRTQQTPPE